MLPRIRLIVLVIKPSYLIFSQYLLRSPGLIPQGFQLLGLVHLKHFLPLLLISELYFRSGLPQLLYLAPDILIKQQVPFVVKQSRFDHLAKAVYLHELILHDEKIEMKFAPVHEGLRVVRLVLEDFDVAPEYHRANLHPASPKHPTRLPRQVPLAPVLLLNIVAR